MASEFSLRCYCYLDRMQPQYAAFVGTITQGDLPVEGMASLYIEMAPGNEVFRTVDIAVKATEAKPGAQVVEREFGMFEIHSLNQAAVLESGRRYVQIAVSDSGSGIPEELRARVLEPLFTTKSNSAGRGMGLSIVNGFVHQSRGALDIDSEPGRGTRVTLNFPTAD